MSKAKDAARAALDQSNPVTFIRRLKGLPLIKQMLRVLDRFL